jgi:hypothetical protein
MKPCMTTCPLMVTTEELEKPEASKANPKRIAGVLPSSTLSCSKALSMSPTSVSPPSWKRAAAMRSMLALMVLAMVMAITTSISSKRKTDSKRRLDVLLENEKAVIYRARGSATGAVPSALVGESSSVFLGGLAWLFSHPLDREARASAEEAGLKGVCTAPIACRNSVVLWYLTGMGSGSPNFVFMRLRGY